MPVRVCKGTSLLRPFLMLFRLVVLLLRWRPVGIGPHQRSAVTDISLLNNGSLGRRCRRKLGSLNAVGNRLLRLPLPAAAEDDAREQDGRSTGKREQDDDTAGGDCAVDNHAGRASVVVHVAIVVGVTGWEDGGCGTAGCGFISFRVCGGRARCGARSVLGIASQDRGT